MMNRFNLGFYSHYIKIDQQTNRSSTNWFDEREWTSLVLTEAQTCCFIHENEIWKLSFH